MAMAAASMENVFVYRVTPAVTVRSVPARMDVQGMESARKTLSVLAVLDGSVMIVHKKSFAPEIATAMEIASC